MGALIENANLLVQSLNWKKQVKRKKLDRTPAIHKHHIWSHPELKPLPLADPSQENTRVRIQWKHCLLHKTDK